MTYSLVSVRREWFEAQAKKYIVPFIKNRTPLMMQSVMTVGTVKHKGVSEHVFILRNKPSVSSVYAVVVDN